MATQTFTHDAQMWTSSGPAIKYSHFDVLAEQNEQRRNFRTFFIRQPLRAASRR